MTRCSDGPIFGEPLLSPERRLVYRFEEPHFSAMRVLRLVFPMLVVATCAPAMAQTPVGELFASDASVKGSVLLAAGGTKMMSGSSVNAGGATASLRLTRGGEVRVCSGTSLSVTSSQSARDLMLGMGTGAIETHYSLTNSADTILTPDFRILLAGPGTFHFAIKSDARGNTCVKALESNTASIIVSELMGDGVYQVRANDQVLFRNGSVAGAATSGRGDCGCPAPPPVQRAEVKPPPEPPKPETRPTPVKAESAPPAVAVFQKKDEPKKQEKLMAADKQTAPPPPLNPNDIHIEVDVPFIFRASQPVVPPPATVARLRLASTQVLEPPTVFPPPTPVVSSPAPVAHKLKKKGFFGRIGSLFASVFH